MQDLTERQKNILEIVITEYINHASPISSKFIENEYDLGVSPATIRAELFALIEKGYLYQPHTSSGRVPTDKGYRFLVDSLSEKEVARLEYKMIKEVRKMQKEVENKIRFMHEFTRFLAETSSSLTVSYFPREHILLKEGWSKVLQDPEFDDVDKVHRFTAMVNDFEDNIDDIFSNNNDCVRVYIGGETPFSENKDFSIMMSSYPVKRKKAYFAIMGPKRMAYDKNIQLLESIIKTLKEK